MIHPRSSSCAWLHPESRLTASQLDVSSSALESQLNFYMFSCSIHLIRRCILATCEMFSLHLTAFWALCFIPVWVTFWLTEIAVTWRSWGKLKKAYWCERCLHQCAAEEVGVGGGGLFWLTGWQHYFSGIKSILHVVTEWSPSGYHVLVLFYFHKCSFVTNTFSFFLIFPVASLHSTNVKNKQSKNYPLLFPTHPQRVKLPFTDTCCCHVFQKVCHSTSCF